MREGRAREVGGYATVVGGRGVRGAKCASGHEPTARAYSFRVPVCCCFNSSAPPDTPSPSPCPYPPRTSRTHPSARPPTVSVKQVKASTLPR